MNGDFLTLASFNLQKGISWQFGPNWPGVGLITNAHTATDSPAGVCQYPVILWYDTVDNQTVLQSDSEHVSCCYCLRHVLIGALVGK